MVVASSRSRRRRDDGGLGWRFVRRNWIPLLVVVLLCLVSIPLWFLPTTSRPAVTQDSYMKRFAFESHQSPHVASNITSKRDHSKMSLHVQTRPRGGDKANKTATSALPAPPKKRRAMLYENNNLLGMPTPSSLHEFRRFPVLARPPSGHLGVVMVIFVGRMLPSYFHAFALSVERSGSQLKWLVFVTEAHSYGDYYEHIEVVRMAEDELFERMARIDPELTVDLVRNVVRNAPYAMVEFKPCLATIFEEYIEGYKFWGYGDIDTIMGRTTPFLSASSIEEFDIYTTSFGDNERFYLRGQLALFKNSFVTNNVWRRCQTLSLMSRRAIHYKNNPDDMNGGKVNGFLFESAEGCISKAVFETKQLRVVSPSVLASDAFKADFREKEILYLGSTAMRSYSGPLPRGNSTGALREDIIAASVSSSWSYALVDQKTKEKVALGGVGCTGWVNRDFQVCPILHGHSQAFVANSIQSLRDGGFFISRGTNYLLTEDSSSEDLSTEGSPRLRGALSKTKTKTKSSPECMEYMISHFQGWKHGYTRYATQAHPLDANMLVVSIVGVVHFKLIEPLRASASSKKRMHLPTYGEIIKKSAIQGRLSPQDLYPSNGNFVDLELPAKRQRRVFPRLAGSTLISLLSLSSTDKSNLNLDVVELRTDYCVTFKSDLSNCNCEVLGSDISLVQLAITATAASSSSRRLDAARGVYERGLTVISVGWAADVYGDGGGRGGSAAPLVFASIEASVDEMLDMVLIVAYIDDAELRSLQSRLASDEALRRVTVVAVDVGHCAAGPGSESGSSRVLPDKLLLNMGIDSARTDHLLIAPLHVSLSKVDGGRGGVSAGSLLDDVRSRGSALGREYGVALALPVTLGSNSKSACAGESRNKIFERQSLMSGVVFSTDSAHGSKAVRLPEELNGDRCFGGSLVDVLRGYGYDVHTSAIASIHVESPSSDMCDCKVRADWLGNFIDSIQRYFKQLEVIRSEGVRGFYAIQPVGHWIGFD